MYCPSPSPNANANPNPSLSPSASVGAYFNFPFAWLGKQKIPTKEQTPQTGSVPQWVFSVSKAMQLWTVAVWLVECQAVSFRKIRDDQFFEEKKLQKNIGWKKNSRIIQMFNDFFLEKC